MSKFFKILGITVGVIATLGTIGLAIDKVYQKKREKSLTKTLDNNGSCFDELEEIICGPNNCEDCSCQDCE